jgi:hypothetical protein
MALEIYGLDLRLAKKMLFTGVNLRIDKPNLVVYVLDEAGLPIEGADVNILSAGHNLDSTTDAEGTALTRFMPAINNTLTVSKDGYATSTQIIYNETPSTLSVYVQLYASEISLKVVNNQNEPIEGATCRVLNAISGSNNVLSFDGVDDGVAVPAFSALNSPGQITVEAWFKQRQVLSNYHMLISNEGTGGVNNGWLILNTATAGNSGNQISWRWYTGSGNVTINATGLTPDTWTHIAGTHNGTTGRIYINANLISSLNANFNPQNSVGLRIGSGRYSNPLFWWNGEIAEVRIWNHARTVEQISELKDVRLAGNEAGLVEYWKLDEATGTLVNGLTNNGTIFGATWQEVEDLPIPGPGIAGYDTTPYDTGTTNANGLTTLNYQINTIHGIEVTLPGKRRFIMPFQRTTRGLLDWQVMLSDYLATFATDGGNILINAEPENNDSNFLIE